jgi:hypothetical protein
MRLSSGKNSGGVNRTRLPAASETAHKIQKLLSLEQQVLLPGSLGLKDHGLTAATVPVR